MTDQPERCEAWHIAQQTAQVDGQPFIEEDYGPSKWSIGAQQDFPIYFCPWCGTKLPDERHQ